ncbi:phosphoribosylformylglycinamidine synthase [Saccharomycopsis crataegensis]|uniref:Phosphoribosylformylglycinamidine synthase n=1 Tax=Saccharomycopsis crataegensis TaxID=43959 RepID=A0AAV5QQ65_9ASCO|nr:phosphoribosylformylglycinamidine synthase [Saccharomycopsis crataegensis]
MADNLLILPGNNALSGFRVKELISDINEKIGSSAITAVYSTFVHYVGLKNGGEKLDDSKSERLRQMLSYNDAHDESSAVIKNLLKVVSISGDVEAKLLPVNRPIDSLKGDAAYAYLVTILPRQGTISPWSSKATNIAHVSGYDGSIDRIERGLSLLLHSNVSLDDKLVASDNYALLSSVFDRMTDSLYLNSLPKHNDIFLDNSPKPLTSVQLVGAEDPVATLSKANETLGLAFDTEEISYLVDAFVNKLKRDPTDVELFMFAQINSEHCRHKIFNATWIIDNDEKDLSLFKMIKNTHQLNANNTISAYSDNSAIFEGQEGYHYAPDIKTKNWGLVKEKVHTLIKVETHNHPTAISPFPGAATGSGGEIRDEGATGKGSKPKAGLSGFTVSNLEIPGHVQPWEEKFTDLGKPGHIASPLSIMLDAPIGSAAFNNEFGRPCITGYFRTLTTEVTNSEDKPEIRGFHKPIMLAGGLGSIRPSLSLKDNSIKPNDLIIVLGGQGMLIGLGGGAASSVHSSDKNVDLDFASVQRGNPEMERRAQEVINACVSLDKSNPILSIHDVGAGGLSNALPELVHDNDLGAIFQLRKVLTLDPGMSPLEIWCNESQERYVLAINPSSLSLFEEICNRERCPFAVIGHATAEEKLVVEDDLFGNNIIDLDMSILFGNAPKLVKNTTTQPLKLSEDVSELLSLKFSDALERVLRLPAVGSKSFLITIGDRTVGGLIDRDQFVGPWQVPVADVGVTGVSLGDTSIVAGEAMAMGERPSLGLISASASAKMCVAESLLNLAASDVEALEKIKVSANWMSAANYTGEGSKLYEAVRAIGIELCPDLGISIPVGKDSLSMKMNWKDQKTGESKEVIGPLSLVITSFAPVADTGKTWTPQLQNKEGTKLVLVDLSATQEKKSLGGSAFLQVYNKLGNSAPTVYSHSVLKSFLEAVIALHQKDIVLAYHDRSDGGLVVTLLEMAFAGRAGLDIEINSGKETAFEALLNEELGAVFQVKESDYEEFVKVFETNGVSKEYISVVGAPVFADKQQIKISFNGSSVVDAPRSQLQQVWSETSYHMQALRDNPATSKEEFETIADDADPGITYDLTYSVAECIPVSLSAKPKVAILREQGVNGQFEMAWCFQDSGFTAVDVHMSDIITGKVTLDDFVGIAACGGFSYGDVLGAANGWARSILYHEESRKEFERFFQERNDTFAFGACNGCQFLSRVHELIPGTENWPSFERNFSEQYEARVAMVEIQKDNKSIFLQDMEGSRIPIAVAHGEGYASFSSSDKLEALEASNGVAVRFVDNYGKPAEKYPFNPNGSPNGVTGIANDNGRVLAMMPHPERVCRLEANSWYPGDKRAEWQNYGPWIKLFRNARKWVG